MKKGLLVAAGLCLLAVAQPADAVVIKGGDGTGNTTAPVDSSHAFPYWSSVGQIPRGTNYSLGGSCVYLGNGYVLTAWHVRVLDNPTIVRFDGTEYSIDTSSWTRLNNGSVDADLGMFHISGTLPDVPGVPHSTTDIPASVANGTTLYAMGYGRNRGTTATTYYIKSGALYTTPPTNPYETLGGFNLSTTKTLRWGTNTVDSHVNINDGYGQTDSFQIDFDSTGGDNECQLSNGDSGGPVFLFDSGDNAWKLVGMNIAVGPSYTSQTIYQAPYTSAASPHSTGGYNYGFIADLTVYRDQLVPEPATMGLLLCGGLALLRRRRRA